MRSLLYLSVSTKLCLGFLDHICICLIFWWSSSVADHEQIDLVYKQFSAGYPPRGFIFKVHVRSKSFLSYDTRLLRLSAEAKGDEAVRHALAVHSAVSSGNFIEYIDLYAEKMRFEALKCMRKSYHPVVPVSSITRALGFSKFTHGEDNQNATTDGIEECEEWLRAYGAVLTGNNAEFHLDTKASSSTIYMPELEDAVAHGDASLAVDNCLISRTV